LIFKKKRKAGGLIFVAAGFEERGKEMCNSSFPGKGKGKGEETRSAKPIVDHGGEGKRAMFGGPLSYGRKKKGDEKRR